MSKQIMFSVKDLDLSVCSDEFLGQLTIEVTDEIRELLEEAVREKKEGEIEEVLFDDESPSRTEYDAERKFWDAVPVIEAYIAVSRAREQLMESSSWNEIRSRKVGFWSRFHEEMESNWLRFDTFNMKVDARLAVEQPTVEQWMEVRKKRLQLQDEACAFYQNAQGDWKINYRVESRTTRRMEVTKKLFEKALYYTQMSKDFWTSKVGQQINALNAQRKDLWEQLVEMGATGLFEQYNEYCSSSVEMETFDPEEIDSQAILLQTQNEMMEQILMVELGEVPTQSDEECVSKVSVKGLWNYQLEKQCKRGGTVTQVEKMEKRESDSLLQYVDMMFG